MVSNPRLLLRFQEQQDILTAQLDARSELLFQKELAADELERLRRTAYTAEIPSLESKSIEEEIWRYAEKDSGDPIPGALFKSQDEEDGQSGWMPQAPTAGPPPDEAVGA